MARVYPPVLSSIAYKYLTDAPCLCVRDFMSCFRRFYGQQIRVELIDITA